MKTIEKKAPKATAASKATTIQLDAALVSKIRTSLRAIRRNQTVEELITDLLEDMLLPYSGMFEGLIEDESRRGEIEAELARIRDGQV